MKYVLIAIVLATTLAQYGDASPRPDFAVPARMTGVASGNLDSTGNVVQNSQRVLDILGQFQSITEWLYGLQNAELYRLATGFRSVMDSLVESGSPVFQSLSNAARLSSGNVSTIFEGIRRNINATVALNDQHQAAINGTRLFLGSSGVQNFSAVLDQLVHNVANLSDVLTRIEPAIVNIQQLVRPTQAQVDALYPRAAVRELNSILREYVNIGTATVPQINAVVNRIRLMDGFIARLASVAAGQWTNLNNSLNAVNGSVYTGVQLRLQGAIRSIRNNFNATVTATVKRLKLFFLDDLDAIRQVALNASQILTQRLTNTSQTLDALEQRFNVVLDERTLKRVMNRTLAATIDLAWGLILAVTSSVPRAQACFSRYNYEFDKIPRLIFSELTSCGQEEARSLQDVASALVGYLGVVRTNLDAETKRYNPCLSGLVPGSSDELKRQRSVCLRGAKRISDVFGNTVVNDQTDAFEQLLREEVYYSARRYYECAVAVDQLMLAELQYLQHSIVSCLN